ncbi:tetratricopeptide repeat protein [Pseudoxanthomonas sp.]|uniref:tetratricopeptide repeat protein n=1 Tax=Pseudoxanthomonas sp. TaxID=1871049 RepID=UPI00261DD179|nr:tetratricopeptide repeat protein [Pseudoxanthomonas sp.]WDS37672.1 MAG: tetratricopeptide repeat protein [Pseudoxanthomonas sp.]
MRAASTRTWRARAATRARLRGVLGRAYLYLGLSTQAEALLRQAAAEARTLDMPYELSSAQHDLALMLSNQNHGEEALAMANSSLAQAERTGDPGMISGSLNMVGLSLKALDRYPEAEDALLRALAMRRAQMRSQSREGGGAAGPDDGSMLHNLALVRKAQGDLAGAERYFKAALEVFRAREGDSSYQYRSSLQGLALVLRDQGRLNESAGLLERGLALARGQLGDGPNEVVRSAFQELAGTYQDLGDLVRSRDYYQQARDATDALGEQGGLDDAVLLNNFATLQELRGDVANAEALYRRSWGIRRDALGAEARMSLTTEANLGRLLLRTGRMDQAEPLLQHAYDGLARLLDADNPLMVIQRLTRAELWMRRGDPVRARQALAAAAPAKGWSSMSQPLQDRRDMLSAEIAQRSGDEVAAAEAWQALVERSQASQPASGVLLAKLRLSLAETLAASGSRASARTQLALASPVLIAQLLPGAEALERMQALDVVLK